MIKQLLPAIALVAVTATAAPKATVSAPRHDGTVTVSINDERGIQFTSPANIPVYQNGECLYRPERPRRDEQEEVWITVSYTYNPQTENIPAIMESVFVMTNDEVYDIETILDFMVDEEEGATSRTVSCEVPVPASGATIMLMSQFYKANPGQLFLFKEVQDPANTPEVSFNASEATVHVGLKVLLPDGTPFTLPTGHYDEETEESVITDPGNGDLSTLFSAIRWGNVNIMGNIIITQDNTDINPNDSNGWDFWTNTTSEDFQCPATLIGYLNNGKMVVCNTLYNPAAENTVAVNNPADYLKEYPVVENSPAWTKQSAPYSFGFKHMFKGATFHATPSSSSPNTDWLVTYTKAPSDFYGCAFFGNIQGNNRATYSPFLAVGEKTEYVTAHFPGSFVNGSPGNTWVAQNPLFIYGMDDVDGTFGADPLYMSCRTAQYNNNGYRYLNLFADSQYGLLGDWRHYDSYDTEWIVDYNGETVFTLSKYNQMEFQEGIKPWCETEQPEGRLTITGVNTNQTLFGSPVTTTCANEVTWLAEDDSAPAIMAMIIRDGDNKVTCDVKNAEGALLAVASVDGIYNNTIYKTEYFAPEKVEIAYTRHGAGEDWTEFEVENQEEGALQTALGLVSTVSLDEIDAPEGENLYDVRIVLEDAAGNRSIQTISPCFRLTGVSGIAAVAADNGEAEYWSLDGLRVNPETYRGIVVCRRGATVAKQILR